MDNAVANLLKSVLDEWNKAEEAIKIAEQVNGEIINPSIYELRYAGRRIVEAMAYHETDVDEAKKKLHDAHFDCCRARHDAIDAATSKISQDLNIAVKKIGKNIVYEKFPDYPKLVKEIVNIRKLISQSRLDRLNRDKIYETVAKDNLTVIVDLYGEFEASEDLIRSYGRWSRIKSIALGIGWLIATILAALGVYYAKYPPK